MQVLPRSVRGRLWAALALLSLAIVCISVLTWIALLRVDERLQELHRQSLSQVAQAIDLSKRASDLATTAPYLLNQRSNFLVEQEGEKLLDVLATVRSEWPLTDDDQQRNELITLTLELETGIRDLVKASQSLDRVQSLVRAGVAELGGLRELVTLRVEDLSISTEERLTWWTLQSMNADALNAAYADNLIGVGEERRHFQRQRKFALAATKTQPQTDYLNSLDALVWGGDGIFELRRIELGLNLNAQNALFRIRREANSVNELAGNFAKRAEGVLTAERSSSSNTIQVARFSVAAISLAALALALIAALYVSRYVAFNVGRVSEAMVRLANGDRSSVLPRRLSGDDEIADLFRSFRSFRANALRLDRSNKLLDQRNALFEKVFENITDGLAITDASGRLTAANPAFEKILSVSRMDGSFVDWLYQSDFGQSAKAVQLSVQHRGHLEIKSDAGQILEIRASRLPDEGRVWLISDVTELRKIAERVAQIDRIELLGKLAGDTAHDFGNILSAIKTHAHLLDSSVEVETGNIAAIRNAVDYGASLTDRLLAFARQQPLSPEVFDLNTLVGGMVELVEIGLKPGVSLRVFPAENPLYVQADPGQLESAISNLTLNSNNAISNVGDINICLSQTPEGYAQIMVKDTGAGMTKAVQSKAIEPFYTTRADQGGTGLGLSIVYGFMNQSGGKLGIKSRVGEGTNVILSLPLARDFDDLVNFQTNQRALLVDDNPTDREATAKVLESLGLQVNICASAGDAIRAMNRDQFEIVVSDFDLGGQFDGVCVLKHAQSLSPKARRILISGKSSLSDFPDLDAVFAEKPITPSKILAALQRNTAEV
ncbi:ATP-binding protein [Cognatishimia sp.]|uniref:ATP-binding protein n=2 Tax=Cognatishimia sp. TaxID=2211648 RepID=UPI003514F217